MLDHARSLCCAERAGRNFAVLSKLECSALDALLQLQWCARADSMSSKSIMLGITKIVNCDYCSS